MRVLQPQYYSGGLRNTLRRYRKSENGASAIEFALVVPLFLGIIFTSMEIGMIMLKKSIVENAMESVTRAIYTGQIGTDSTTTRDDIISGLCDNISTVINCKDREGNLLGNITMELLALPAFSSEVNSPAKCIDRDNEIEDGDLPLFSDINGDDIVFVRFCITIDLLGIGSDRLTHLGVNLGNSINKTDEGRYALITSTVFKTEPFKDTFTSSP